ncbi:hypothetical protein [Allofournierella sp. CML151]|uniref:hypothetical protein n=1 Tax=Allofournierella sp. CML151 TaxID=2998082 RepID=UPI0022EAB62A|nr:hypothetical protein [Fournierella sp. CML151]
MQGTEIGYFLFRFRLRKKAQIPAPLTPLPCDIAAVFSVSFFTALMVMLQRAISCPPSAATVTVVLPSFKGFTIAFVPSTGSWVICTTPSGVLLHVIFLFAAGESREA